MDLYYKWRNAVIRFFYVWFLRPVLFLIDAEKIHIAFLKIGDFLGRFGLTKWGTGVFFDYKNSQLQQNILGIKFENPIGLSAGFDKDIEITDIIGEVGFGFTEVGSVTAKLCAGNPRPRLWRLKKEKSLGVWYGLKNSGVEILSKKLSQKIHRLPIGVNVAFTNCKENSDISLAIADYIIGFKKMEPLADYMTVNLSCPNTSGGMPFLVPENYDRLMIEIDEIKTIKPVFVKINPDMSHEEIDVFLKISERHRVHGIICSNLTKKVKQEDIKDPLPPHGGLSGKLIYPKALDLLSYMYKKTGDKFIYVFSGGIFSAEDAYEVMCHGASLIELITSMIYEGPQVISEINRGLVEKINRGGFKNLSEIVGIENLQK